MMERWLYSTNNLSDYGEVADYERTNDVEEAVLISSEVKYETGVPWIDKSIHHAPAIDIDLECRLVGSSTPGHYHLYIDKEMVWEDYEKLLAVLKDVGIVEEGFYNQAVVNQKTFLRVRHKDHDPKPSF
jgi:hypothetical protein